MHSAEIETARAMVRVREARRTYRKFYAMCFWSYRKDLEIGLADLDWVAETLKKNGDMRAWRAAGRLVGAGDQTTLINWSRDPAWCFMPPESGEGCGVTLHAHRHILPLGAMIWAAVAKGSGVHSTFASRAGVDISRRISPGSPLPHPWIWSK